MNARTFLDPRPPLSRRQMLQMTGLGFGTVALAGLLQDDELLAGGPEHTASHDADLRPRAGHLPAQANSVIMMMQNGGPSQMELFDPKPQLARRDGQVYDSKVEMFQKGSEHNKLLAAPFRFRRYGKCEMELSEVVPRIGSVADELCLVRSMYSEHNNHTEALVMMNTGKIFPGRPVIGSWVGYALGTENRNLPAYVVLRDPSGYNTSGTLLWQNAWLPAIFRGTEVSAEGTPIRNLAPAEPQPAEVQRANLEFLDRLNQRHLQRYPYDSRLETRIRNYELAARMQLAAAQTLDLAEETQETLRLYGVDEKETEAYGRRCLLARRLVESGVRFVQVFPPSTGQPWDAHTNVKTENESICAKTDHPTAGLITDLKRRGLLESTIVLWTGEFGRLPVSQNGKGRDHNRNGFSLFLAGGGFKPGYVHGATDEVGYRAVVDPVGVPDLHATILHQLGIDHRRLTFLHHGRPETLTDAAVTGAHVVGDLLRNTVQTS